MGGREGGKSNTSKKKTKDGQVPQLNLKELGKLH